MSGNAEEQDVDWSTDDPEPVSKGLTSERDADE